MTTDTMIAGSILTTMQPSQARLPKDLDAEPTTAGSVNRQYRLGMWGLELWNKVVMPAPADITPARIALVSLDDLGLAEGATWEQVLTMVRSRGMNDFPLHYAHAVRKTCGLDQVFGSEWLLAMNPLDDFVAYFSRRAELQLHAKPLKLSTQMPGATQLLVEVL